MTSVDSGEQGPAAAWVALPAALRAALREDYRRIVIVGARGWIGRTLLELADEALGPGLDRRVACFGSGPGDIVLSSGRTITQAPLDALPGLPPAATMLFHLAFLTMDKVSGMTAEAYAAANRAISAQVLGALDPIGVDRLFVASSGAAAFADDRAASPAMRLYGGLKREDEDRFAAWAAAGPAGRRAAICRIYSVSGPFINKHSTYALADLILRAARGEAPAVQSPRAVMRSYVAVSEVMALALAMLTGDQAAVAVSRFDSGGRAVELGDLAAMIAAQAGVAVPARTITATPPDVYCGDDAAWQALLHRHGLVHAGLEQQIGATARWLSGHA